MSGKETNRLSRKVIRDQIRQCIESEDRAYHLAFLESDGQVRSAYAKGGTNALRWALELLAKGPKEAPKEQQPNTPERAMILAVTAPRAEMFLEMITELAADVKCELAGLQNEQVVLECLQWTRNERAYLGFRSLLDGTVEDFRYVRSSRGDAHLVLRT